jgi:hypothetical protein
MTRVITADDVGGLESSGRSDTELAETLVSWTREPDVRYGVGVSPAELLSLAATHQGIAGDLDAQWTLLEQADAAEGATSIDVKAKMVASLVLQGRGEEAVAVADQLRKSGVHSLISYVLVASSLADIGDQQRSLRWLNMGLRAIERRNQLEADEAIWQSVITDRYLLRRQLELGKDSYDEEAELLVANAAEDEPPSGG